MEKEITFKLSEADYKWLMHGLHAAWVHHDLTANRHTGMEARQHRIMCETLTDLTLAIKGQKEAQ